MTTRIWYVMLNGVEFEGPFLNEADADRACLGVRREGYRLAYVECLNPA